jgi:hypothetical protein
MSVITLLACAALVCALGVVFFTCIGIMYRKEDWAWMVIWGILLCIGGAGWCIEQAIERADTEQGQSAPATTSRAE